MAKAIRVAVKGWCKVLTDRQAEKVCGEDTMPIERAWEAVAYWYAGKPVSSVYAKWCASYMLTSLQTMS